MRLEFNQETLTGSDCSGNSGDTNRVLTLSNIAETQENNFYIYLDGLYLQESLDYSVVHKTESSEITISRPVWDNQKISVDYYTPVSSDYGRLRIDVKARIKEHGQQFTLKRVSETTDAMGGVISKTTESYTIYSLLQNVNKKDRKIHDMGLAVSGNMKAIFYDEYSDSITGNGTVSVHVGDILEESDGKQWRVEAITSEIYAYENEILRVGVLRNINLEE